MRVAILVKEFPPDVIGGTEIQTQRLARELHARGHDVTVFTKQYPGVDGNDSAIDIVRVPNVRLNPFLSTLTFVLMSIWYLFKNRRHIDVLQCMMVYPTGPVGYLLARIAGLPYFAWVRGGDFYFMKEVAWKRFLLERVFRDTLVLVQTPRIKSDVLAEFPEATLEVLGNGVEIPDQTANGDQIVFVGRLAEQKGVDVLIEALAGLDEHLLVLGDGSQREELETLARDLSVDAEFVGQVPPEEVREFLSHGKLFVLPAVRGEGLPNAVLEAMAVGLPVIVTDVAGVPDVVENDITGYVVPPGDSQALRERIKELSNDSSKRSRMGERAQEYVENHHSWERIVAHLDPVYNRIAGVDE